jgi:hypothetical protein
MADKQLSRLEQELYSLWEFIENGCDARPEDKHDALSTLDRIKLFFSETREHSITQAASESAGVSLTSGMESGQAGERPAHFSHDKRQDTPRTDAQHAKWRIHDDPYTGMVNHARQLERELAEMTAHADTWMETCRKLEDERELIPSHVAALTPDWCMDAFWRANPGRNAVVPSLYLLDFAREVLRVHGVQSATAQRNGIIEECAKQCDASADEAEELLRRQPWSEYARACMNEAASLAIRIRALAAAESRNTQE